MYTKDRTIEIRKRCDAFLKEHGLRMKLHRIWGDYHVSFEGDDYRSPVTIMFVAPNKDQTKADWDRCNIEVQTYGSEKLGDTDWKFYYCENVGYEGPDDLDAGYPGGMLERAAYWLEREPLVPMRKGLPGIINSEALAILYYDVVEEMPEARDLAVIRDAEGERIEFVLHGRHCKVTFVPPNTKRDTPERAVVKVEGAKAQKVDANSGEIADALMRDFLRLEPKEPAGPSR